MSVRILAALAGVALLLLLVACAGKGTYRLPAKHPPIFDLGERREFCIKCHGYKKEPIDFERYNHTPLFTESHRLVAYQDQRVCALCHEQSFCNDCHVTRTELKPSDKYPTENYRRMQHRGDYLSRHRIDGRLDPISCYRCHGNPKSSQTCQPCHG
ncbi:MAG: cytochrome C [Desulfuromonadales bacterium]|nr:MAG: cytochrome C [Desulfuromonadales bacterium]